MKTEKSILTYREELPAPEVSHLVYSFWEFTVSGESNAPVLHEIFPDGCISLIYRRNEKHNFSLMALAGLAIEPLKFQVLPGDIYWSARFSPAASRKILQGNPADWKSQPLVDEKLLPHLTRNWIDEFGACRNFAEAIGIYEKRLATLGIKPADLDAKVVEAVKIITASASEIKISEVAEKIGLSARQLQRRFLYASGITPKQFVRVQRFRRAAIKLVKETEARLVDCAAEMGFTDQAHLSRESHLLIGHAPKSFVEIIKRIKHDKIIG